MKDLVNLKWNHVDSVVLSALASLCTFQPPAKGWAGIHHEDEENWSSFLDKGGASQRMVGVGQTSVIEAKG